jgi:anti-sigma factor RsiW
MHAIIEDHLEHYLAHGQAPADVPDFAEHLATCPDCREEVALFAKHSHLIRGALHCAETPEPRPGFYARVMDRIDSERQPSSYWEFFLQPFTQRLVYASLALFLLMGAAYLKDDEPSTLSAGLNASPEAYQSMTVQSAQFDETAPEQQEAVIVTFASWGSSE